ncbi:hypothetical protein T440DRAFT_468996 [Plenodomus tracheiphilus IPT5]|uniref:Large ribosomal subunit protein P1 n=1 Tax=Plenodomus tracheiphilus IPT5 TaxID=1408161 RepID=A0A6A7B5J6_9PLEO|nr:hypothetical protein T440DRAFT_468996 [Plenodomus tracheiphilus IPT5]
MRIIFLWFAQYTTHNPILTSMSTNKSEQAVALAALILADESITITPEKLQALLKAAGVEDIEPIWTTLFANALKGKDVKEILTTVSTVEVGCGNSTVTKEHEKEDEGYSAEDVDAIDCGEDRESSDDDYIFALYD